MQEPIGQGIKNLSRMFKCDAAFSAKTDSKWSRRYSGTQIPRIRRGGSSALVKQIFKGVLDDPNTARSVVLVLSGIGSATRFEPLAALCKWNVLPFS